MNELMTDTTTDRVRDQAYFDASFRENPNHWEYDKTRFRIRKHLRTWQLIRNGRFERVCELGCAAGVFTGYLRRIAAHVDAYDISDVVLECNRRRFRDPRIRFHHLDVARHLDQLILGEYDLVVVMEILNYMTKDAVVHLLDRLAEHTRARPAKVLLNNRLSNGDANEYGANEFTCAEFTELLRSRFTIFDVTAVQLREEPIRPNRQCREVLAQLGIPDAAEVVNYLYARERLAECSEMLSMGACCDDVEMAAWLLEGDGVSS